MRGTRLRWEAHRGAGPGWREGHLGNMCVPWTYTEQSCRPRTRWEVGRGMIDRVVRGHVRNGLSGAGSHRWAWSRMRADLHVRRSPWWLEAMPYPLPPAPGQDLGLFQLVVNGCYRQASLSFEARSLGLPLSIFTYITEPLFTVILVPVCRI